MRIRNKTSNCDRYLFQDLGGFLLCHTPFACGNFSLLTLPSVPIVLLVLSTKAFHILKPKLADMSPVGSATQSPKRLSN